MYGKWFQSCYENWRFILFNEDSLNKLTLIKNPRYHHSPVVNSQIQRHALSEILQVLLEKSAYTCLAFGHAWLMFCFQSPPCPTVWSIFLTRQLSTWNGYHLCLVWKNRFVLNWLFFLQFHEKKMSSLVYLRMGVIRWGDRGGESGHAWPRFSVTPIVGNYQWKYRISSHKLYFANLIQHTGKSWPKLHKLSVTISI